MLLSFRWHSIFNERQKGVGAGCGGEEEEVGGSEGGETVFYEYFMWKKSILSKSKKIKKEKNEKSYKLTLFPFLIENLVVSKCVYSVCEETEVRSEIKFWVAH